MSTSDLRLTLTALLLVAVMVTAGWLGRRLVAGIAILAMTSLAWLTVDSAWEGPHLFEVTARHSIVTADLVGLLGLVASAALTAHRFGPRRPKGEHQEGGTAVKSGNGPR